MFIVKTNEFYCVPVFSGNARKFVMLDNSSAQVILPSTTISTERIGFAQVSCLDKEVWIRMKNETTEQFNEWLSQLVSVEDSRYFFLLVFVVRLLKLVRININSVLLTQS